ncbi:PAS domain-containing sensor histidine kinase [bacterium]|nr:PAS domain-containing sensor histidine kinase [bacterium]
MTPDPKTIGVKPSETYMEPAEENSVPAAAAASDSAKRARGLAGLIYGFLGKNGKAKEEISVADQPPELLDLLLEGPDALIVVHTERGEIVEVSKKFCEWSGRSREELLDVPILQLFPESERKIVRTLYEDAGAGGVHVVEVTPATPGQTPRLIEFTARRSDSGGGEFALLVGRDVGERALSERYLRVERDRLHMFIRAMRDGLVLLNVGGDIVYVNPTMETYFESYELPVICHRWLKEFSKEDHTDLQGLTSAYGGKTLKLDSNDGRMFLVTRSFLFETGKPSQVMLMCKDITEQAMMEKQNHYLELELIRESKLAEFGMLVAGIAHNLNGPLTGILGLCDVMKIRGTATAEIEQMRKQATVMRDLIANLLHKSRNEQEVEPRELDIREVIDTELRFLEGNLFFKHQITRNLLIADDLPTIYGLYLDLSQVVGNLVRNAIDAMYNAPKRQLTVKAYVQERYLVLQVADTGCGISPEIKSRIFEPFFTTKPKQHEAEEGAPTGTGLGLSSSRSILARYGASIDVESEEGHGTTFTVKFPIGRKPDLPPRQGPI